MDDHDQRFKTLLQEFLPEFMALFFPHWVDRFDFTRTEWPNVEAFLDPPERERKVLDLVAKVPTTVPTGERPDDCLLLIHVEVESAESATRLRNRMLQYYAYLRRTYDLPVLPIGLFLYVGFDGIGRDSYQESLWDETFIRFDYIRIGLPALDGIQFQNGPNLLGLALSALMKLPSEDRARILAEGVERIALSGENDVRRYFLAECYENYFPLSDDERENYQRIMAEQRPEGRELMGGLELREQRGERRGRMNEKRDIVVRLLTKKFGSLSEAVQTQVNSLSPERLDEIVLSVIDATSLAELGLEDS